MISEESMLDEKKYLLKTLKVIEELINESDQNTQDKIKSIIEILYQNQKLYSILLLRVDFILELFYLLLSISHFLF